MYTKWYEQRIKTAKVQKLSKLNIMFCHNTKKLKFNFLDKHYKINYQENDNFSWVKNIFV